VSIIAEFTIQYEQYLNPEGKLSTPLPSFFKEHPEALKKLYELMVLLRVFDTKAINLQRTGKMGTYASTLGQEAVSVGIGYAMKDNDVLVPYYRDYGAFLQRGVTLTQILQYWGGDERGSDFQGHREDFPICVPIATQFLHAAGIATAFRYRKEPRAVVVTGGDGSTSQGDFYEALNVAGEWQLPVVFVINNNQWAISVSRKEQTHCKTLAQKAIAAEMPGIQVDGNDVIAVCQVVHEALHRAREGNGPTLIEAINYRLCDHTTADDASRYVPKEELTLAWEQEPIKRFRHYLETQSLWNEKEEQSLQTRCQEEVTKAIEEYATIPPQPITAMFDFMYETPPKSLKLQRAIAEQFKE